MGILLFFSGNNGSKRFNINAWLLKRKTGNLLHTKSFLFISAWGIFLLLSSCLTPQQASSSGANTAEKVHYAVLISQPDHLRAAVQTAQTMRQEPKYRAGSFVIMACARSVEAFRKDSDLKAVLEAGKAAGITYKVCGLSLEKFNIEPEALSEGVEISPNGLTYLFDLKQQGYVTVEL